MTLTTSSNDRIVHIDIFIRKAHVTHVFYPLTSMLSGPLHTTSIIHIYCLELDNSSGTTAWKGNGFWGVVHDERGREGRCVRFFFLLEKLPARGWKEGRLGCIGAQDQRLIVSHIIGS